DLHAARLETLVAGFGDLRPAAVLDRKLAELDGDAVTDQRRIGLEPLRRLIGVVSRAAAERLKAREQDRFRGRRGFLSRRRATTEGNQKQSQTQTLHVNSLWTHSVALLGFRLGR